MNSLDTNFTCFLCMDSLKKPVTYIPCGHNFCGGCHKDHAVTSCPKCDKAVKGTIPDNLIEDVIQKYFYQKDSLSAFKNEEVWRDVAAAALKQQ